MDIKSARLIASGDRAYKWKLAISDGSPPHTVARRKHLRVCTKHQDRAFAKDMIDFCVGAGGVGKLHSALFGSLSLPSIQGATTAALHPFATL